MSDSSKQLGTNLKRRFRSAKPSCPSKVYLIPNAASVRVDLLDDRTPPNYDATPKQPQTQTQRPKLKLLRKLRLEKPHR